MLLGALYASFFVLLWRQVGQLLVRIREELDLLRAPSARQRVLQKALQSKMVMFSDFRAALLGLGVVEVAVSGQLAGQLCSWAAGQLGGWGGGLIVLFFW